MKNIIEILHKRGFIDQVTDDQIYEITKKPIKFYVGFDPTFDSLHIGHLVGIMALCWLKKYNHEPIALIGGSTARIGDPSGKSIERPFLDDKEILKNIGEIKIFLEKILGKEVRIINNNDWFKKINFIEFLRDIGKYFRIGPMLAKESVKLRMQSKEGMSFTEFSYQILQAYDYYHLFKTQNVILQMGGSDQWGNITAGIELIRKITKETVYGISFPLLTKSDGKKFGKTEKGAVWLSSERMSYYEFYQYLIRVPDSDVIKLLKMLTFLSMEEIDEIEKKMRSSNYISNTAQKRLAEEVCRFIHGEEGLQIALNVTKNAMPGADATLNFETLKEISNDMPHVNLPLEEIKGKKFIEVAFKIGLCSSRSEAVRLIKNNGAYLNNKKISDQAFFITEKDFIQNTFLLFAAGKKKKILVSVLKK